MALSESSDAIMMADWINPVTTASSPDRRGPNGFHLSHRSLFSEDEASSMNHCCFVGVRSRTAFFQGETLLPSENSDHQPFPNEKRMMEATKLQGAS